MNLRMTCWTLLVTVPFLGGCVSFIGPEDLRFGLSLDSGVGLDREFAVGIDGFTAQNALSIAGFSLPIGGLRWVDVGVYRIRGEGTGLVSEAQLAGYEPMVRIRDGSNEVKIFVKQTATSVNGLVVLAREGGELVVVRVIGRIDALFEELLEKGGFEFDLGEEIEDAIEQPGDFSPQVVRAESPAGPDVLLASQ